MIENILLFLLIFFLDAAIKNSQWEYFCVNFDHATTLSVPIVQAMCPPQVLLNSILNITDISKLIASSSFRAKIAAPYQCYHCKEKFDVKLIVCCVGIRRRSRKADSKIRDIDIIAPIEILDSSEEIDQNWNDIIQNDCQRFYKCRKGHTALLTHKEIVDHYNLKLNGYQSINIEWRCHRCDLFFNVSLDENIILPQGTPTDISVYRCNHCGQSNTTQIKGISFSDLNISKIQGIQKFIQENEEEENYFNFLSKYSGTCCNCSKNINFNLEVSLEVENPFKSPLWKVIHVLNQHINLFHTKLTHCLEQNDDKQLYQCDGCKSYQMVTCEFLEENHDLDYDINQALVRIDNSGPLYMSCQIGPVKVNIDRKCSRCGDYTSVSIKVQPGDIYWEDVPDHRMDSI